MKDLKHIKRFNEAQENLNISDVRSSIINRQKEIDKLRIELETILAKTKDLSKGEIGLKGYNKVIDELKSKILELEQRTKLDRIKIGEDVDDLSDNRFKRYK
jgi:hypothetical protein